MTAKQFEKTGSQSLIYKPKKEKLAKNVKMPKYPRKSHFRETFTIDQKSKPDC